MAEQQQQQPPKKEKTSVELFKQSFREYLKETSAVPNDEELDQLMALLHEPLPVSFRVNLHRPDAQRAQSDLPFFVHIDALRVQKLLATELQFPENTFFHNDTPITPPKPIAWYPLENVAWQVDCGRTALSKSAPKHEVVKAFHSCLLEHTEIGTIDRQEAVSMLPVLFLDVQPAQRVLDMCASPGSKTTQVIDFLLSASPETESSNGMVIANDLDKKRAYMLVHRLTRNTLRNAVVICGAGDLFPGLYDKASGKLQPTNVFDRVLCDVPCSGDGTLRKNQALWKEWHIGQGLTLHPIQLSLALRGAALLKIGGVMVYSTCSFNPVENEAVVAELLRRSGGALELVDVSQKLPTLIYRKGRTTWNVGWRSKSKSTHKGHLFKASTSGDNGESGESSTTKAQLHEWYGSYDDIPQELRGQRVVRSMFAPANSDPIASELEKTLRLIPTDQNSGGFFIAALRKKADLPGEKQEGLPALAEDIDLTPPVDYVCKLCNEKGHFLKNCEKYIPEIKFAAAEQTPKTKKQRTEEALEADGDAKKQKKKNKSNEPYVKPRETLYRPISDDAWELIQEFYGIQDATLKVRFWCRSDGAANVNYVDEEISDACLGGDALEIVNTGLKVFTKLAEKGVTYYRPSEEALGFINNFFTKRIIKLTSEDFALLLQATAHLSFESLASASAQEFLAGAGVGPGVAQLETNKNVSFNVWIGKNAILPRVSKTMRTEVEQALKLNA